MFRRQFLVVPALAMSGRAFASDWPNRPIKIIVPAGPGSPSDVAVRSLQDVLSRRLGQALVIENRAGGLGGIGVDALAKAVPDGYTLGVINLQVAASPALRNKSTFDLLRDLQMIGQMTVESPVMIVRSDLPVRSLKELVTAAKKAPGKLTFGTPGPGSPSHLGMELLSRAAGMRLTHVPYKTAMAAVSDVAGGQIDVALVGSAAAQQGLNGGRVRALAISASARHPSFAVVPTLAEEGFTGIDLQGWTALAAPAGVNAAIVSRIASELSSALADPLVVGRLDAAGAKAQSSTPAGMGQFLTAEIARWSRVIASAEITGS